MGKARHGIGMGWGRGVGCGNGGCEHGWTPLTGVCVVGVGVGVGGPVYSCCKPGL